MFSKLFCGKSITYNQLPENVSVRGQLILEINLEKSQMFLPLHLIFFVVILFLFNKLYNYFMIARYLFYFFVISGFISCNPEDKALVGAIDQRLANFEKQSVFAHSEFESLSVQIQSSIESAKAGGQEAKVAQLSKLDQKLKVYAQMYDKPLANIRQIKADLDAKVITPEIAREKVQALEASMPDMGGKLEELKSFTQGILTAEQAPAPTPAGK